LITGGSRGLGLAIVKELADKKARLVLYARNARQLEKAQQTLTLKGCEVLTIKADLTKPEDALKVINKKSAHFGCVDVLINNAGIMIVEGNKIPVNTDIGIKRTFCLVILRECEGQI
jgi:short-subunit dehydrogenase